MKQKQKRKHLESPDSPPTAKKSRVNLNLQEDPQDKQTAVASTSAQAAREASSSSSEYFSYISSEDRFTGAGPSKLCTHDPQPSHPLEDNAPEAKSGSSESEYFSCYSSLCHLSSDEILKEQEAAAEPGHSSPQEGNNVVVSGVVSGSKSTQVLNPDEDLPPPGPSGLAQGRGQMAKDSISEYFSSISSAYKFIPSEFWKSQEDVPQPESFVVVPPSSETAKAKSSASEYFSCVSSVSRLTRTNEDGVPQTHQDVSGVQHSEECETSSPFPHVSFPFHSIHDPKPSVSSVHMEEEMFMKVYYMHVQMKRGVAVLCDPEEGLEPPSKKTKMEEMTFPENIQAEVTPSQACTKELLTGGESGCNNEGQEERAEADGPPDPLAVEECPRAKTPEWLVALDSGFRCMACCRVFPSLEVLQEHVKHGVSEGFSCYTFHLALTWLKNKNRLEKEKRQAKHTKKTTYRCQKEKHLGMKLSSCK